MKLVKHIPNALSALRIALAVSLLFLAQRPWLFTAVYLVCGLTDVFDGKIARRYHVESSLGSKLDAVGDSLLFGTAAISVLYLAKLDVQVFRCLAVLSVAVAYKLANVAVTRFRFGEWNMMHTLLNKVTFVTLFFCVPVFLLIEEINFWMVLGISAVMCLACLEETVTLVKLEDYDVNCKGILGEKLAARRDAS